MKLDTLLANSGEWLRGTGPDSDVVVSSRVRLARNLSQFPFPVRAEDAVKREVFKLLAATLGELDATPVLHPFEVDGLDDLDRHLLVERQLISRELADGEGARGVAVSRDETVSVMMNEEDHLRIQVLHSGFAVKDAWEKADALDDAIEAELPYAFDEQFGFLTACPTNCGTGMRASVMLHLPALVLTKEIQKVFGALQKIRLAVRGLYGEGSQAMGDYYQISNQVTLGASEKDLVGKIGEVVPNIISYERRVRKALIKQDRRSLHDQIARAHGVLRSAQTISSEETMGLLSSIRLGVNLGLIDELEPATVNELFIHTQPAHLQKLRGEPLDKSERNVARAGYLREKLANAELDTDE